MSRPKTSDSIAREINRSYKASIQQLENSMEGLPKTCKAYLDRVVAIAKLRQQHREELVSRGLVRRDLGTASRLKYEFRAVIDDQPFEVEAKRAAWEQSLDEEFPSVSLPEPEQKKTKKKRTKQ